jgi:transposase
VVVIKAVPGRKTEVADAQWLATLACAGLLRASFIPPVQMRQLRPVARQRQKLEGMCSAEKNRLHKVLFDAGMRMNVLVADIHASSVRAMVKALMADKPKHEVLDCKGRLRASRQELLEALDTEQFSAAHLFVAHEIMEHIEQIEQRNAWPCCWWRSARTWAPSAAPSGWPVGWGSVRAMSARASARPNASASATPGSGGCAARTRCALKAKFDALSIRKGRRKSVVAVAHKMLRERGFIAMSAAA